MKALSRGAQMRRGARWVARIAAVAAACALALPPLTAAAAHAESPGDAAVSVVPLRPLGPNDDPTTPPGPPDDGGVWTNQLCEMFTKEDVPNYQQWRKFCLDHPGGLRSADNTEITFHNTVYRMPTRWLSAASGYFSKLDGGEHRGRR